jgi:hypothetical protein
VAQNWGSPSVGGGGSRTGASEDPASPPPPPPPPPNRANAQWEEAHRRWGASTVDSVRIPRGGGTSRG